MVSIQTLQTTERKPKQRKLDTSKSDYKFNKNNNFNYKN